MPSLVSGGDEVDDVPRDLASFAYVLKRRMEAPEDVRGTWQRNHFLTGDGSVAGPNGNHLIVLEDLFPKELQFLRKLNRGSELYDGALVLPDTAWNDLKVEIEKDADKGLYLTAEEVKEACKGYVKKGEVWVPANRTVGKIWNVFSRGRDLAPYAKLVSEGFDYDKNSGLLNVFVNKTSEEGKLTMRPWSAESTDYHGYSCAVGGSFDDDIDGCVIGVAPKVDVDLERVLGARVLSALESGNAFEFNGRMYAPVNDVSL